MLLKVPSRLGWSYSRSLSNSSDDLGARIRRLTWRRLYSKHCGRRRHCDNFAYAQLTFACLFLYHVRAHCPVDLAPLLQTIYSVSMDLLHALRAAATHPQTVLFRNVLLAERTLCLRLIEIRSCCRSIIMCLTVHVDSPAGWPPQAVTKDCS